MHPAYAELGGHVASNFKAAGLGSKLRPDTIARTIARIAEHPAPKLRHPVGAQARFVPVLKSVLPQGLFEAMIRRQLRSAGTARHDGGATGL